MSLDTFDKTQSQYERKMARQRQLELMEAAASGQTGGNLDLDAGSHHSRSSASSGSHGGRPSLAHAPPEGAIESARRFLWDEDEDDAYKNKGFSAPTDANHNVNLMAPINTGQPNQNQDKASVGSRIMGSLPRFSAKTGTEMDHQQAVNLAPRRQNWHTDASPSTEPEEYLGEVDYNSRRNQGGSFLSPIGDCCLAVFHTIVGLCALLVEYMVSLVSSCGRCFEGYTRKQCCILLSALAGLGIFIFAIVALAKRGGGGGGGGSSKGAPNDESIQDMLRFNTLRTTILDSGFTGEDHLDTTGTAQNLALRWLTDDDPAYLQTDDDMLLQRYALATFFFSTYVRSEYQDEQKDKEEKAADEWNNMDYWMTEKGICLWWGVVCPPRLHEGVEEVHYNENADVIHLNLTANNIRGTIPSELIALENLVTLDVGKNDLEGTIPMSLTKYRYLEEFYLEENNMSGTVPTELGKMTLLKDLYIGTNRFSGTIPSQLNKLKNLRGLGLDECFFTGTIPYLWDLKNLLILYLDSNELTGHLSDRIGNLRELVDFRVRKNFLNGTMPIEFHYLTKLQLLYMDDNEFSGTVPEVFDRTPRLEELHLYKNNFFGVFPDSIEKLDDLKVLYLDNNKFQGTIPRDWGNLRDVHTLYIFNNELEGTIPETFGELEDLKDFQVQNNRLHGSIPTELGNCFKLEKLELQDNEVTGNVPTEFGELEKLAMLKVYRNKMSGTVPKEVCTLTTDFDLAFLAADCTTENGGLHHCDCCDACYP